MSNDLIHSMSLKARKQRNLMVTTSCFSKTELRVPSVIIIDTKTAIWCPSGKEGPETIYVTGKTYVLL